MEKTSTMKQARTSVLVALALICVVSCAKIDDESSAVAPEQPARPTVLLPTRSYEEALSLAWKSIALVDRGQTRSATARSIRSERGQCVTTPSTRSGAGSDTLMYVFNFENNDGFSVIAANRAVDPVLAVAEKGNYTYGEPTGVENFDFYMDAMAQSLAVIKPPKFDTIRTTPKFKTVEVNESRSCDPAYSGQMGAGISLRRLLQQWVFRLRGDSHCTDYGLLPFPGFDHDDLHRCSACGRNDRFELDFDDKLSIRIPSARTDAGNRTTGRDEILSRI